MTKEVERTEIDDTPTEYERKKHDEFERYIVRRNKGGPMETPPVEDNSDTRPPR